MKSKTVKIAVAAGLLLSSAVAFAASADCCGDVLCCIKMLVCC
ncbi:hypothetical protein [Duganella sp.]